jgi:hypothetical protein
MKTWMYRSKFSSIDTRGEWSASRLGRFAPKKTPQYSLNRREAVRAGLDMEKLKFLTLLGLGVQLFGRPARSQSLYQPRNTQFRLYFFQMTN